eukprot:scaffold2551_cov333-Pavlova_lutheri.AAC.2
MAGNHSPKEFRAFFSPGRPSLPATRSPGEPLAFGGKSPLVRLKSPHIDIVRRGVWVDVRREICYDPLPVPVANILFHCGWKGGSPLHFKGLQDRSPFQALGSKRNARPRWSGTAWWNGHCPSPSDPPTVGPVLSLPSISFPKDMNIRQRIPLGMWKISMRRVEGEGQRLGGIRHTTSFTGVAARHVEERTKEDTPCAP